MRRLLPACSFPALGLIVVPLLAGPATAQDGLEGKVTRLLQRADASPMDRVWEISNQITDLDGQDDALARAIASGAAKLGDTGRLAAARALANIAEGTGFGPEILATLQPVADSDESMHRAAAMGLLGTPGLFGRRVLPDVRDILAENTTSELVEPTVRVEAAKALWNVGDDRQRSTARETLTQFLSSTNRQLKIQGALALADINSTGPAWDVLYEIQDEPTPEGRLARLHLKMDAELRRTEHLLQRAFESRTPDGDSGGYGKLDEIIRFIQSQHILGDRFDREILIEAAAKGMLNALDRHSSFFSSDEFQRFFFDLNREYGGIGAFVNFDRDGVFSIVRPIYSGPAYRAGLRSGDKIIEVDGWETTGHTSEEIISRLKGQPDTKVVVKMFRPGMEEPADVPILREQIQVPSVNTEILPGNIGYIELITFGAGTAMELRAALLDMKRQGVEGLVLDVRSNTGGFLVSARDVVEQFVEGRQRVVYTKTRNGRDEEQYSTRDRAVMPNVPMAVLINEYSASASEIVAGALSELGRAVVVGKRSYGKGSVQSLIPLRSAAGEPWRDENDNGVRDDWEPYEDENGNGKYDVGPRLKLTIARYHLPSGRTPNKEFDADGKIIDPDWGILPDVEVGLNEFKPEEAWKTEPLRQLLNKGVFRDYAKQYVPQHPDLFMRLAEGDGGTTENYPDFDEFYAGLDTKLPRDDIRRWLRFMVRDSVADLRGKAFAGTRAMGDPQEDAQLQTAIGEVLKQLGRDIADLEAYKRVLKIAKADGSEETVRETPR